MIQMKGETKMNWTKEKPTKDGWYWFKPKKSVNAIMINFKEHLEKEMHEVEWPNHTVMHLNDLTLRGGRWYGSLKPPKEGENHDPDESRT